MSQGSAILLCCVKPAAGKECFTAEEFIRVVGEYGPVLQIIVFSRKTIVKLFVQFSSPQSASSAIQSLSQAECEFGKIQVFPSDKPSIRCDQTDPRDYWTKLSKIPCTKQTINLSSNLLNKHAIEQNCESQLTSLDNRTRTNLTDSTKVNQNDSYSLFFDQFCEDSESNCRFIGAQLDFCSNEPSLFAKQNKYRQHAVWHDRPDSESALFAEPPSILLIHNFDHKSLEATNVAGLLSCWGVVSEVLVSKRHHLSFVTFVTRPRESAYISARELNGNRLFTGPLHLEVVSDIHPKYIPNSSRPDSKRLIFRKSQTDIFTAVKPRLDTHVTRYLLITDASVFLTEKSLVTLLMELGRPRSVLAVRRESPTQFRVAARNTSEAVRLVSLLQGLLVDDSRLVVQFAKSGNTRDLRTI